MDIASGHADPMAATHACFYGCSSEEGQWRTTAMRAVTGQASLADVASLWIKPSTGPAVADAAWVLRGFRSNLRYTTAQERQDLIARQAGLGRPSAPCAALIPIRKTPAWWALAQDERQAIFDRSAHTAIGMDYLPAVARQLYHARDLAEPFDFLTWFEYAPADEPAFDRLLDALRDTEEWGYVDQEIDIRLRAASFAG